MFLPENSAGESDARAWRYHGKRCSIVGKYESHLIPRWPLPALTISSDSRKPLGAGGARLFREVSSVVQRSQSQADGDVALNGYIRLRPRSRRLLLQRRIEEDDGFGLVSLKGVFSG